MSFEVFRNILVLFFCVPTLVFGQSLDNDVIIELGATSFPIERPFTISVIISNSENRPAILFPDIPGFTKKGASASVTNSEVGGKAVTNQVIIQNYQARLPGRYRLPPFSIEVNGEAVKSEGALLIVQPSATSGPPPVAPPAIGEAFLTLNASKNVIYTGEGVALTLSFFVADNYPYVLNFTALDKQLQAITKKIRPANTWEENKNITELKPIPVFVKGKKFREYRLYQAVFFPLTNRALQLPGVPLWLERQPVIGPPSPQPQKISFTSRPVTVNVRSLPAHPLRGQVAVGSFRLKEGLERQQIKAGRSVRYTFGIEGEGNIATLSAPVTVSATADVDIFPPEQRQVVNHFGDRVVGRKTFTYFIVPHQNGTLALANRLQWIYFDPQSARYDTLRPELTVQVGGSGATAKLSSSMSLSAINGTAESSQLANGSLYAGIEALDSTEQPINGPALIRAVANVMIVVMLVGLVFVFFKK